MTAGQRGDVAAWLDRLEELRAAATEGVWEAHSIYIDAHTTTRDTHRYEIVANSTVPADAACIVAEHAAVPQLVAAIRGVLALADELETRAAEALTAARTEVSPNLAKRMRSRGLARDADAKMLRTALAAALTDGTPR